MVLSRKILILILFTFSTWVFTQETAEELKETIGKSANDTVKANALIRLAEINFQNELEQAAENIRQLKNLSRKLNYQKGLDEYLNLKGKYHFYNEQIDSALYWYKKYGKSSYVRNRTDRQIVTLINIGLAYSSKNQLDSAYHYLNQSLEKTKNNKDSDVICSVFNNLGIVLAKQNNLESSIEYFELAYDCYLRQPKEIPSQILINLATLYAYTHKDSENLQIEKLLKKSEKRMSRNDLLSLYINLGSNYNNNKNAALARRYLIKADSIGKIYQNNSSAHILHALAHTEMLENNPKKALELLNRVNSEHPNYSERAVLLKDLAKLNFDIKNYAKSKFYYEQLILFKDSVFHAEIENTVLKSLKDIEFYKKETEIKDLELEKNQLLAKRNKERGVAIIVSLILIFSILLFWFNYKKEKTKRKLNEVLVENKNKKLLEFHAQIAKRNQAIAEIEKTFSEYKNTQELKEELKEDILDALKIKGEREIYNYYFEDQHKGFYQALKKIAPDLTNNELRLCSLTKLRMSLKETAVVLNLSVDAIKSGRYRLKKKLGVEAHENLSDFLNQINN